MVISADIFAVLLRYFKSSIGSLIIIAFKIYLRGRITFTVVTAGNLILGNLGTQVHKNHCDFHA